MATPQVPKPLPTLGVVEVDTPVVTSLIVAIYHHCTKHTYTAMHGPNTTQQPSKTSAILQQTQESNGKQHLI